MECYKLEHSDELEQNLDLLFELKNELHQYEYSIAELTPFMTDVFDIAKEYIERRLL